MNMTYAQKEVIEAGRELYELCGFVGTTVERSIRSEDVDAAMKRWEEAVKKMEEE